MERLRDRIKYNRIYILLAVSVGVTLFTGLMIYQADDQRDDYSDRVLHTMKVIESSHSLSAYLKDAETGIRGYLLTEDPAYQEPYLNAIANIDLEFDTLIVLTEVYRRTPEALLDALGTSIDSLKQDMATTVFLLESEGAESAIDNMETDRGKAFMDNIRQLERELITFQYQLLEERSGILRQAETQFKLVASGGLLLIVLITIGAGFTIQRKANENRSAMDKIDDINAKLYQARDKETLKNRYLGVVTHDLRNPLHAVISFTDLMQSDGQNLTSDQKEYLGYISQSAEQMKTLTSEMMDVQKIEEGVVSTHFELLRVHKILDGLIAGHKSHADEKEITIELIDDIRDQYFKIDKSVFLQVSDNLISNAIKFSPSGSTITITLESENHLLRLLVADQGPGIKKNELHLLFSRFQKLSNRPTAGESSTGLGLSIVKDRIEAVGGTIECKSEPGVGSTFIAEFPVRTS